MHAYRTHTCAQLRGADAAQLQQLPEVLRAGGDLDAGFAPEAPEHPRRAEAGRAVDG